MYCRMQGKEIFYQNDKLKQKWFKLKENAEIVLDNDLSVVDPFDVH